MTLNLIGIGLNDEKDITVKGLELVKKSDLIYLESYTSKLQCDVSVLEEFYGKKVIIADRGMVEGDDNEIIQNSKDKEVSLLIIGDVFSATTHTDIMMRCKELKIDVRIVNNAAILTAVGITGLQLYKFGKTTSIPYPEENFEPETAYDVIKENNKIGLHTLCLLDIKKDLEKYMTVNEAMEILLKIESKRGENVFTNETFCVGCARLGGDFVIKAGKASELLQFDFGKPLHCLIVPGKMHFMEEDILSNFK
jgi:diphthine synthase